MYKVDIACLICGFLYGLISINQHSFIPIWNSWYIVITMISLGTG